MRDQTNFVVRLARLVQTLPRAIVGGRVRIVLASMSMPLVRRAKAVTGIIKHAMFWEITLPNTAWACLLRSSACC
jgi:hypothetical protein